MYVYVYVYVYAYVYIYIYIYIHAKPHKAAGGSRASGGGRGARRPPSEEGVPHAVSAATAAARPVTNCPVARVTSDDAVAISVGFFGMGCGEGLTDDDDEEDGNDDAGSVAPAQWKAPAKGGNAQLARAPSVDSCQSAPRGPDHRPPSGAEAGSRTGARGHARPAQRGSALQPPSAPSSASGATGAPRGALRAVQPRAQSQPPPVRNTPAPAPAPAQAERPHPAVREAYGAGGGLEDCDDEDDGMDNSGGPFGGHLFEALQEPPSPPRRTRSPGGGSHGGEPINI